MEIDIINADKLFNNIYLKYAMNNKHRYQLYYGGSSSGKSYFLAQRIVIDVLNGRNYLVVRNVLNTVRRSILNEIIKAIHNFKLIEYFSINKTDLTITCNINQMQILFAGLDDPEKIKSITPISGIITDIFIEEATEISYQAFKQLDKRLRGESSKIKRITFAFNPILKDSWLYKEFFTNWQDDTTYLKDGNISILKTTYKDNKFLTEDDIKALESEQDKYYYEVYTLGNWGILGNLIFTNWKVMEFDYSSFDNIRNGLDFGFGVDPLAYARMHIDKKHKKLYIFDELYMTELSNEDAVTIIKDKLTKATELIVCDSSEPKSIKQLHDLKLNAVRAKKGPGSIETGIKFLKGFEILIHPKCINAKAEFSKYKWKEDKNGIVVPIPIDRDNHLIDAIRYALESDMIENKMQVMKNPFF